MIPKKIHYCWFGGNELSELNKRCIESWKKYCPDYEIIEWNEKNFDLDSCDYVREAYEAKKWAFVSDYARLFIIYNYGGIYLDTDVELIKKLDYLLDDKCFLGTEELGVINTGLGFGAEPKNKHVELMLNEYSDIHFKIGTDLYDFIPCPERNTKPFLTMGFKNEDTLQKIDDTVIYPIEYFCPLNYTTEKLKITNNTISIHHFNASWMSKDEKKFQSDIQIFKEKYGKVACFIYKNYYEYRLNHDNFTLGLLVKFAWKKIYRKFYRLIN